MPATQLGAMPLTQLRALPLVTAQAATTGGIVNRNPGGGLTRFWDPATLGITAANFGVDGFGYVFLATNFISVYGCRRFSLLLTRTNAGVGGALSALDVRIQYRSSPTDVPPTSFGMLSQQVAYTGSTSVLSGALLVLFPAMQVAAQVQRASVSWDNQAIVNAAVFSATEGMIGDNVRLFLNIGSGGNPGVANLFSAALWATS